jgi:UTP:GlnB (protein PII) uridylyltransferase
MWCDLTCRDAVTSGGDDLMGKPETSLRKELCLRRLEELRARIQEVQSRCSLGNLAIYCTGSYARFEASEYSDLDIFFLHTGRREEIDSSKVEQAAYPSGSGATICSDGLGGDMVEH